MTIDETVFEGPMGVGSILDELQYMLHPCAFIYDLEIIVF